MKSRTVTQIVKDIKSLKIQGAQKVAFAALEALNYVGHKSKAKTTGQLKKELEKAVKQLNNARSTEPLLRNYTKAVLTNVKGESIREAKESVFATLAKLKKYHREAKEEITHITEQKILKGSIVFTHCHSSTVTAAIINAHKRKKKPVVTNTEARPVFQGRITATELAKKGIPVHHFVDSSVRHALKKADIMLIGADAITPYAVINKVGSAFFAEIAHMYDVPVYICAHSLKFDPQTIWGKQEKIEQRDKKEIWAKPPKNVHVHNPAFEEIAPEHITGIISELGIYPHAAFIQEVRRQYPWVFEK